MSVNVGKCAIMRMTKQKLAVMPRYYLGGVEVRVVNEFKYLGVHISNKCTWQNHVHHVNANQMLRFIKRNFKDCPRFLQIRLRHESRDKYVIHISKTAFQKNAILKRRITM